MVAEISARAGVVVAMLGVALLAPESALSRPLGTEYAERDFAVFYDETPHLYDVVMTAEGFRQRRETKLDLFYGGLPRLLVPVRQVVADARAEGMPIEPYASYLWGDLIEAADEVTPGGTDALKRAAEGPFPRNAAIGFEEYTFWFTISGPLTRENLSWLRSRLSAAIDIKEGRSEEQPVEIGEKEKISVGDLAVPHACVEVARFAVCADSGFAVRPQDLSLYEDQLARLVEAVRRRVEAESDGGKALRSLGLELFDVAPAWDAEKTMPRYEREPGETPAHVCDLVRNADEPPGKVMLVGPLYEKPNLTVRIVFALRPTDFEPAESKLEALVQTLVAGAVNDLRSGKDPEEPERFSGKVLLGLALVLVIGILVVVWLVLRRRSGEARK